MSLLIQMQPIPLAEDADGAVRVGGTRVTLDSVVHAFNRGATAEEILQQYDALRLDDIYAVLAYYLQSRSEVDAYLAQRDVMAADVRREVEQRFEPEDFRERLLSRRRPTTTDDPTGN